MYSMNGDDVEESKRERERESDRQIYRRIERHVLWTEKERKIEMNVIMVFMVI